MNRSAQLSRSSSAGPFLTPSMSSSVILSMNKSVTLYMMRSVTAPSLPMEDQDPADLPVEMEELSLDMVLLRHLPAGRLPVRSATMFPGSSAKMSPGSSVTMYPGNSVTMYPGNSA